MWSWYIRSLPRVPYQLNILSKVPINFWEIELNSVSSRNLRHKHNIGFAVLGTESAFGAWLLFAFRLSPALVGSRVRWASWCLKPRWGCCPHLRELHTQRGWLHPGTCPVSTGAKRVSLLPGTESCLHFISAVTLETVTTFKSHGCVPHNDAHTWTARLCHFASLYVTHSWNHC